MTITFFHLTVLGVREVSFKEENHLPLVTDNFDFDQQSCCHPHDTLTDNGRSQPDPLINIKYNDKVEWTCARFYEEKIHKMLESFNEVLNTFEFGCI